MGPLPPQLVHWWQFEQNFNDTPPGTYSFTPNGNLAFIQHPLLDGQQLAIGNVGLTNADYMSLAAGTWTFPTRFTFTFWFFRETPSIVPVFGETGATDGVFLIEANGTMYFNVLSNTVYVTAPETQGWQFYGFSLGLDGLKSYVAGLPINNTPCLPDTVYGNGDFRVGGDLQGWPSSGFDIDSLRLYDGQLDDAGVLAIYNSENI